MRGRIDREESRGKAARGSVALGEAMRSDEISASRVARVRQNPVTPFSVRWRVHDASLRGRRMVPRPPARHFQPVEMNNTSMDLVRVSVKREMTREITEDTKKIHNEGTKITKRTKKAVARRPAVS
jgi:hypothetical protein